MNGGTRGDRDGLRKLQASSVVYNKSWGWTAGKKESRESGQGQVYVKSTRITTHKRRASHRSRNMWFECRRIAHWFTETSKCLQVKDSSQVENRTRLSSNFGQPTSHQRRMVVLLQI